jgi:hypothetical protein
MGQQRAGYVMSEIAGGQINRQQPIADHAPKS